MDRLPWVAHLVRPKILALLLDAGADPNLGMDVNPPFIALLKARDEASILIALQSTKIPVNLMGLDPYGSSPAVIAAMFSPRISILKAMQDVFERDVWMGGRALAGEPGFLLPRNHLWTSPDANNVRAWHAFVDPLVIRWLLEQPDLRMADAMDQRSINGRNALAIAVDMAHLEIARILLALGADLNAVDHDGVSAIQLAMSLSELAPSRKPMFDLLKSHEDSRLALSVIEALLRAKNSSTSFSTSR